MTSPTGLRALAEIEASSINARWSKPRSEEVGPSVSLFLPHRSFFTQNIFSNVQDRRIVTAGTLRVTRPELRGHGIGERLTKSLGLLAYKYGYNVMSTHIASEHALDIFGHVFGEDRIGFFGKNKENNAYVPVPFSFEEARNLLVEEGEKDPDPEHRYFSIGTLVQLDGIDTSGWEPAIETAEPDFDWSLVTEK